jgi:hypothetical protein
MSSIHSPATGLGSVPSGLAILASEVSTIRKHKYIARSPVRDAMRLATQRVIVIARPCPVGFEVDTPRAVTKNIPKMRLAIQGHLVGFGSLVLVFVFCRLANENPPKKLLYTKLDSNPGLFACFSSRFPESLHKFLLSWPKTPLSPVICG